MIPGTVLLLGSYSWGPIADALEATGIDVLEVAADHSDEQRYLTAVVVAVRTARPAEPLVLLGVSVTGAALPAVGLALTIAGHRMGGYLFADASLPGRSDAGLLEPVQIGDWPDAPCGYLQTSDEHAGEARLARLRGWTVLSAEPGGAAAAVVALIDQM